MKNKKILQLLYGWRVRMGSLGLLLALILAKPSPLSLGVGFAVCYLGLGLRAWACGHLKKDKSLAISGPYRFTRNPLYLGNLVIGISVVIASRSVVVVAYFILYFLIFYPVIVSVEKAKMKQRFPAEYLQFEENVPLFFPTLKPSLPRSDQRFKWSFYYQNKEWRAGLASFLFWVILFAKLLLLK